MLAQKDSMWFALFLVLSAIVAALAYFELNSRALISELQAKLNQAEAVAQPSSAEPAKSIAFEDFQRLRVEYKDLVGRFESLNELVAQDSSSRLKELKAQLQVNKELRESMSKLHMKLNNYILHRESAEIRETSEQKPVDTNEEEQVKLSMLEEFGELSIDEAQEKRNLDHEYTFLTFEELSHSAKKRFSDLKGRLFFYIIWRAIRLGPLAFD